MMQSVGMKEEARLRENGIKGGSLVDDVLLAILSKEFVQQDISIS
jgi:RimJ/RimL family protein N-acetyltransferase